MLLSEPGYSMIETSEESYGVYNGPRYCLARFSALRMGTGSSTRRRVGATCSSGTSLPRLSATAALVAVAHWWHPTGPSPRLGEDWAPLNWVGLSPDKFVRGRRCLSTGAAGCLGARPRPRQDSADRGPAGNSGSAYGGKFPCGSSPNDAVLCRRHKIII